MMMIMLSNFWHCPHALAHYACTIAYTEIAPRHMLKTSQLLCLFFTYLSLYISYEYIMHKQILAILCVKSNEAIFQLPYS